MTHIKYELWSKFQIFQMAYYMETFYIYWNEKMYMGWAKVGLTP